MIVCPCFLKISKTIFQLELLSGLTASYFFVQSESGVKMEHLGFNIFFLLIAAKPCS